MVQTLNFIVFFYEGVIGQLKVSRYVEFQENMVQGTINSYKVPEMRSQKHKQHKLRSANKKGSTAQNKPQLDETEDLTEEMLASQTESWNKPNRNPLKKSTRFGDSQNAAKAL